VVRRADPDGAAFHVRVLEQRHERAGRGVGVAEPEMAGVRVVLVDTRLDQPQPEEVAIEGRRPLEVAADQRDVVNARNPQATFFRSQG
jgi:hypothetical protein